MRTAEFRRYLENGRGNAALLLQADPENPEYRAALREACIEDQRYDGLEEERGSWLAGLMSLTGEVPPHQPAVPDATPSTEEHTRPDWTELDAAPWERVREVLEAGKIAARGSRWGKHASSRDLLAAAEWLIASRHCLDAVRLRDGLSLFQDIPFPCDPAVLAEILRDARAAGHPKVVACATTALAQLSHPICRDISRELMPSPEYRNDAIDLLVRNYAPGDYEELAPWFREAVTEDQREAIGMSLRGLAEAHPEPGAVPLLLHQYETGACSLCRHGVVKLLLAQNALPDEIREECRHDADSETRALFASEGGESC